MTYIEQHNYCGILVFALVVVLILLSVQLVVATRARTEYETRVYVPNAALPPPVPPPPPPGVTSEYKSGIPEPPRQSGRPVVRTPNNIYVPTRGIPEQHRRVGILSATQETLRSTPQAPLVLPLLGRRTSPRSHRWNYITYNDTQMPIRLAVWNRIKGRDCTKKMGCNEFSDEGQEIYVPPFGTYVVDMDERVFAPAGYI